MNEIDAPCCLVCQGPLTAGPIVHGGVPDFPGAGYGSGQTLTAVPVIGRGPFAHCAGCGITYRVSKTWAEKIAIAKEARLAGQQMRILKTAKDHSS